MQPEITPTVRSIPEVYSFTFASQNYFRVPVHSTADHQMKQWEIVFRFSVGRAGMWQQIKKIEDDMKGLQHNQCLHLKLRKHKTRPLIGSVLGKIPRILSLRYKTSENDPQDFPKCTTRISLYQFREWNLVRPLITILVRPLITN